MDSQHLYFTGSLSILLYRTRLGMSYIICTPPSLPFSIPQGYSPEERTINTLETNKRGISTFSCVKKPPGNTRGVCPPFLGELGLIQLYRKAIKLGGSPVRRLLDWFFSIMESWKLLPTGERKSPLWLPLLKCLLLSQDRLAVALLHWKD